MPHFLPISARRVWCVVARTVQGHAKQSTNDALKCVVIHLQTVATSADPPDDGLIRVCGTDSRHPHMVSGAVDIIRNRWDVRCVRR